MEIAAQRMVENGFVFVAFLVLMFGFIWRVLSLIRWMIDEIVGHIKELVLQQRSDSERFLAALEHHDQQSQTRHLLMMHELEDHQEAMHSLLDRLRGER
jgi:predicted PurR-regulated permease PerM